MTALAPEPAPVAGWRQTFSSLAVADFRVLWLGLLFSMASNQIDIVARAWLAYDISGSALTLGLVALARGLPMLPFSALGGVVADRFDKRKVLISTQLALSAVALANAVLVHLGIVQIWHLVVLGALQGSIQPFNFPARQGLVPEVAGERHLSNAVAMSAMGINLNRVLAPALAGVLLAWNPAIAYYTIAAFYGLGAVLVGGLPSRGTSRDTRDGALAEVVLGWRYIWDRPVLRTLILLALVPVILGMPYQQLLPVFQVDVLHVGPAQLGLMYTGVGAGSLLGTLVVARFSEHPRKGLLQMALGASFGLSLVLFSLSHVFEISIAFLVAVGFCSQGYLAVNSVLLMLNTERAFYGRVMSVYLATWSMQPVALLPIGTLTDFAGAPTTLAGAGVLLTAFIVLIAGLYPTHWRAPAAMAEGDPAR